MKIRTSKKQGSVLMAALVIAAVIGLALLSYLSLANSQNVMTVRSEAWNSAMPIVEAGIEEAIAHLTTNPADWGTNGWKGKTGDCAIERSLGDQYGYYTVTITNRATPVILARGRVRAPLATNYITRTVRVDLIMRPDVGPGLGAKGTIDLNGNKLYVDSFDSSDPAYSTLVGGYDQNKHKDGVTVATNLGVTDAVNIGNADVWGKVATGPGGAVDALKNGVVGSTAWHSSGTSTGIEPGYYSSDADIPFPPIVAPVSGAPAPSLLGNLTLGNGTYEIGAVTGTITVTGNAKLIVRTTFSPGTITLAPGATLDLFVYASTASFGPNSYNFTSGSKAENLNYYGMPSNTSVSFNGNCSFMGVLYAPDAVLSCNGGATVLNFFGASLTKSVKMNGGFNFHYDEALLKKGAPGYIIASWNEL
jgi:hypothetical protein